MISMQTGIMAHSFGQSLLDGAILNSYTQKVRKLKRDKEFSENVPHFIAHVVDAH